MPLTFFQELLVDLGDLFEPLLNLGKADPVRRAPWWRDGLRRIRM